MEAATSGSQEVVDLLLAAGADPMVRDKDGVSPLMSAAAQVCWRVRCLFLSYTRTFFLLPLPMLLLLLLVSRVCISSRWDLNTNQF